MGRTSSTVRAGLLAFVAASLALVAGPTSLAAQGQRTTSFSVDQQDYKVTLPAGFCLPQGVEVAIAQQVAALDTVNETLLHIFECGVDERDYMVIKIQYQRQPLPAGFPRDAILAAVAQQFDSSAGRAQLESESRAAEEMVGRGSNEELQLRNNELVYGGRDETCVYLQGRFEVDGPGGLVDGLAVGCLSPVGGYLLAFNAYGTVADGATYDMLRSRARDFALATAAQDN